MSISAYDFGPTDERSYPVVQINIRVREEVREGVKRAAHAEGKVLGAWVEPLLEQALVGTAGCLHPGALRRDMPWGFLCSACGSKVTDA